MNSFNRGRQPCAVWRAKPTDRGFENMHDCMMSDKAGNRCKYHVSFCLNCSNDHHEDGYLMCARAREDLNNADLLGLLTIASPWIRVDKEAEKNDGAFDGDYHFTIRKASDGQGWYISYNNEEGLHCKMVCASNLERGIRELLMWVVEGKYK